MLCCSLLTRDAWDLTYDNGQVFDPQCSVVDEIVAKNTGYLQTNYTWLGSHVSYSQCENMEANYRIKLLTGQYGRSLPLARYYGDFDLPVSNINITTNLIFCGRSYGTMTSLTVSYHSYVCHEWYLTVNCYIFDRIRESKLVRIASYPIFHMPYNQFQFLLLLSKDSGLVAA